MFPKSQRLPLSPHSKFQGSRLQSDHFLLIVAPSPSSISRFAVVISKKISPLAVTRHHLKRQFAHLFRQNISKKPLDYLVVVYKGADQCRFADLEKEVKVVCSRLSII